jgi:hypothetical protein
VDVLGRTSSRRALSFRPQHVETMRPRSVPQRATASKKVLVLVTLSLMG